MAEKLSEEEFETERKRRQRSRSMAIAWIIVAMVVLFYAATIIRLGGNVFNRPNLLKGPKGITLPADTEVKSSKELKEIKESQQ
ncbi:MAG: hypothetical protein ACRBBN_02400 [Methyloligellaceae bacterium]